MTKVSMGITKACDIANINEGCTGYTQLRQSRFSSRWDYNFQSYMLIIYIRLYSLYSLVVFHSLVRRGYILKVSVQLVPKYFSRYFSTDSISWGELKKQDENNIKTIQQHKTETRYCSC